jgi:hypothetical protein
MSAQPTCCRTGHNFRHPDYKSSKKFTDLKLNNNEDEGDEEGDKCF